MNKTDLVDGSIYDDPFGGEGTLFEVGEAKEYSVWLRFDKETGEIRDMCHLYDHNPILELNKYRLNENMNKRWGDGKIAASIPAHMLYGEGYYARAFQEKDETAMKKFLNDADNRHLRTFAGNL